MVELINRARMNPSAEAALYNTSLNEGLPDGSITSDPKQPLAINPALIDSARNHSEWMLQSQTFSHTGDGGSSPDQRMAAAGYQFNTPFEWAENIAWQSQDAPDSVSTATLDAIHQNLFVDTSEVGRGHRLNMMDPNLQEVGVGAMTGQFMGYNAVMETEDYAFSGSQAFLTGVAYNDNVVADHFYTVGEGLGGIQITATRASGGAKFSTTTWDSGGYTLQLPAGTYSVQASGSSLNGTETLSSVVIGTQNVEEDFTPLPPQPAGGGGSGNGGTGTGNGGGSGTSGSTGSGPVGTPSRPTAALNRHRYAYTSRNGHYFCFTVTYSGTAAIQAANLGALAVSGPNKFAGVAHVDSTQSLNGGNTLVAVYYVRRPRGTWGRSSLGLYTIRLPGHVVRDSLGDVAAPAVLGNLRLLLNS